MPHLAIKLLEGKTEDQKQKLALALIKAAREVIGYGDESYSVTIEDFSTESWFDTVYQQEIMGKKDILYKAPGYKDYRK